MRLSLFLSITLSFFVWSGLFLNTTTASAQSILCRQSISSAQESQEFERFLALRRESPLAIAETDFSRISKETLKFYRNQYEGRNLVIFTDASWDQKSGVITVMKILRDQVKSLTGMNVVYVTPEDFKYHFNTGKKFQDVRVAFPQKSELVAKLKELNPAAIHIMVEGSVGMSIKKLLIKNDIPFTSAYHTDFPKYFASMVPTQFLKRMVTSIGYWFFRNFHKKSDRIMAPTQSMAQILMDNGFAPAKIAKWSHGVEEQRFTPNFRDENLFSKIIAEKIAKGEYSSRTQEIKKPISLFVGRIEKEKNLDDFLEAKIPGTKIFIGDGNERVSLQQKYPDAIFLGKMPYEDLPRFYASADAFVFTSLTDTFGLVMLEAMATGTPVLAYNVQGPVDVVLDSKAGVLAAYNKATPEQNIQNLEIGFNQVLKLKREDVRAYAEKNPWTKSIVEFLYFLHPLEQADIERVTR